MLKGDLQTAHYKSAGAQLWSSCPPSGLGSLRLKQAFGNDPNQPEPRAAHWGIFGAERLVCWALWQGLVQGVSWEARMLPGLGSRAQRQL